MIASRQVPAATAHAAVRTAKRSNPARYWTVSPATGAGESYSLGGTGFVELTPGPDGVYLGALFAAPGQHGVARRALSLARRLHPGKVLRADCFAGLLPLYEHLGWHETGRLPFDPAYAPADWDPAYGTPDVVAIAYAA